MRHMLTLLLAAPFTGCGSPLCGEELSEPGARWCVVDSIQEAVESHWPLAPRKGVDMDAFRVALHGAADASGEEAFFQELRAAVAMLKDGHTRIERPWGITVPDARLRRLDDEVYVARASADLPLSPGDRVTAVDGVPTSELLEEGAREQAASTEAAAMDLAALLLLGGTPGSLALVELDDQREVEVPRPSSSSGAPPPAPVWERFGNVGYVRVFSFAWLDDVDGFDRAMAALMDAPGLVVDLRGNGGGHTGIADAMLGRLLPETPGRFCAVDGDGDTHRCFGPSPRGAVYGGPVAVIVDSMVYSAANYFSWRLLESDRAELVGERTGGGAGIPAVSVELLSDVVFRVSSLLIIAPDGTVAEDGLPVDVPVSFSPGELAQGLDSERGAPATDKALATALELLGGSEDAR